VPEVVAERATGRVLTTEYVDAMRWSAALQEPQEQRDAWGQVIARFVHTSVLHHGEVNIDTHPGNYLFHDDGTVTFLDFGCVTRFDPDRRDALRRMVVAFFDDEEDAILDALVGAGFLKASDGFAPEALLAPLRRSLLALQAPQPFRYSSSLMAEAMADHLKLRVGADELRLLRKIDVPRELVLLGRATVGLEALLCELESCIDYREIIASIRD
jgi:predicted unusual protein kinase regulating ubiquinone biosynthesis (AarF/ABC1/UbiB family)